MADAVSEGNDHRRQAEALRAKWRWFLALGVVLAACGAIAIALPEVSNFAAGVVVGSALAIAGVAKMVQSLSVREWAGFIWQELTGAAELIGGVLIIFYPLKGALSITLLIALMFLVQGIMQITLAVRVRDYGGWHWLMISGLIAITASAAIALKVPYTRYFTPGIIIGISLLVAGCAYVIIALTMRKARST